MQEREWEHVPAIFSISEVASSGTFIDGVGQLRLTCRFMTLCISSPLSYLSTTTNTILYPSPSGPYSGKLQVLG